MKATVLPCGERSVLVEVDDLSAVLALDAAVRSALLGSPWEAAVEDVVTAARTLLVTVAEPASLAPFTAWLADVARSCQAEALPPLTGVVTITVTYDGPDLDDVARHTGLTPCEVIGAHTSGVWRVAFGGFAPGFAYLVGGDERLVVPRRATPRTAVPAGAVALAGEYSGVYPQASPGGWQIIGHTEATLWDAHRTPPALLRPGVGVQFVKGPGNEVPHD